MDEAVSAAGSVGSGSRVSGHLRTHTKHAKHTAGSVPGQVELGIGRILPGPSRSNCGRRKEQEPEPEQAMPQIDKDRGKLFGGQVTD